VRIVKHRVEKSANNDDIFISTLTLPAKGEGGVDKMHIKNIFQTPNKYEIKFEPIYSQCSEEEPEHFAGSRIIPVRSGPEL
jgi:hypothetical protein